MKALIAIFSWVAGLFGSGEAPVSQHVSQQPTITNGRPITVDTRGVTIVGTNPRTVVALEDTHFRPKN